MFHAKHAAREAAGAASRTRPNKGSRGRAEGRKGRLPGRGRAPAGLTSRQGARSARSGGRAPCLRPLEPLSPAPTAAGRGRLAAPAGKGRGRLAAPAAW